MADTVDGAEHAFDRGQHGIDAGNGLAQTTVVVDQLGTVALGDLAQMRDLAIAPANVENGSTLKAGRGQGLSVRPTLRPASIAVLVPLVLSSHLPIPMQPRGILETVRYIS